MTQVQKILDLARGELGTREMPANSNRVKYNTAYYGREVSGTEYPWCCVFLWWIFSQAEESALFYGGERTASCSTLAAWAQKNGRLVKEAYQPGDLVFLRFSGKTIQHIGLVESVRTDGMLVTIEGNTSTSSDANGGEVLRRIRAVEQAAGAYRPAYEEEEMTQEQFNTMMDAWLQARMKQDPSDYSREAREWAEQKGLIQGDASGNFQYKSFCTREQLMVFLHRISSQKT